MNGIIHFPPLAFLYGKYSSILTRYFPTFTSLNIGLNGDLQGFTWWKQAFGAISNGLGFPTFQLKTYRTTLTVIFGSNCPFITGDWRFIV